MACTSTAFGSATFAAGDINTFAGNQPQGEGFQPIAPGQVAGSLLNNPTDVVLDAVGNLYIVDSGNNVIRKVTPAGIISTVAGNGQPGYSGDNGPATSAMLNTPKAVAVDSSGNLYIADYDNCRIRLVEASTGIITTIAGNGTPGYSGDGGAATSCGNTLLSRWCGPPMAETASTFPIPKTIWFGYSRPWWKFLK